MRDAGDEVADVTWAAKRRHGVAIGFGGDEGGDGFALGDGKFGLVSVRPGTNAPVDCEIGTR